MEICQFAAANRRISSFVVTLIKFTMGVVSAQSFIPQICDCAIREIFSLLLMTVSV